MTPSTGAVREADAVIALLCDRDAVARLSAAVRLGVPGAVRPGADLVRVERVAELRAALAERRASVVVLESRDADGVPTDEAVRTIRATRPAVVVIGYVRMKSGVSSGVLAFARAGVHELVMGGVDDFGAALRAGLANGVQRSGAERLLDEVAALVPPSVVPLVRFCFEHSASSPGMPAMSAALGMSRQALAARTRAAGVPAPSELSTWCRLLLAADLLADRTRKVEDVALELDFSSGNALRNALRLHAELAIEDARRDGSAPVLEAFRRAVAAERVTRDPTEQLV